MKKFLTAATFLFLISSLSCFSQSKRYIFSEVSPIWNVLNGECTLRINYGQAKNTDLNTKLARICDENGNPISFSSRIDVLNWFSSQGWEFCSTISGSGSGGNGPTSSSSSETWLLKYCVDGFTDNQLEQVYNQFNIQVPE